jgi:uncharacterized protein (TIGR02266 family)
VAENGKERRVHPSKDVSLRVRVKSENVDDFVEKFAHNISKGGLFLRSQNPYPVDTVLQFEIQLKDGSSVLRGRGKVTWSQPPPGSGDKRRSSGMGVKFVGLDAASRALVQRILEHKEEQAELPTVEEEPAPARPAPVPVEQRSTPSVPFWRRLPLRIWLLLGGAALGALVVMVFLSLPKEEVPEVATPPKELAPQEIEPPETPKPEPAEPPPQESASEEEDPEIAPQPIPKKNPVKNRFGYLSLNTNPWVEVYLGPRKLGVTPLVRVKLRAGKHRLKLVNWEDGINSPLVVEIRPSKTTKLVKRFSP